MSDIKVKLPKTLTNGSRLSTMGVDKYLKMIPPPKIGDPVDTSFGEKLASTASQIKKLEGEHDLAQARLNIIENLISVEDLLQEIRRDFIKLGKTLDAEGQAAIETLWDECRKAAQENAYDVTFFPPERAKDRQEIIKNIYLYETARKNDLNALDDVQLGVSFAEAQHVRQAVKLSARTQKLRELKNELGLTEESIGLRDDIIEVIIGDYTIEAIAALGTPSQKQVDDALEHFQTGDPKKDAALKRTLDFLQTGGMKKEGNVQDVLFIDDKRIMEMAVKLWEKSYKVTEDLDEVFEAVQDTLRFTVPDEHQANAQIIEQRVYGTGMFLARWAHYAFPKIVTQHTYAAALMSTSIVQESVEDLVIQWPAFEVVVPNGMLVHEGIDYDRIRVYVDDRLATIWIFARTITNGGGLPMIMDSATNLPDILAKPLADNKPLSRIEFLARRLVAGLLLAMQHTQNFKERTVRGKQAIGEKRRPPDHRVVFVGAPIAIDARPAIKKFLESHVRRGKPAPPSIQFLVRGHWKRQVVGVGRSGRKLIWVLPYWKGPEDAPILNRPKALRGPASP